MITGVCLDVSLVVFSGSYKPEVFISCDLSAGQKGNDLDIVTVFYFLFKFARVGALLVQVDLDIVKQFTLVIEYLFFHARKLPDEIIERFTNSRAIGLYCFPTVGMLTMGDMDMNINSHVFCKILN